MSNTINQKALYITGLAHEYPTNTLKQGEFKDVLTRLYPDRVKSPGLQTLIGFNLKTKIASRPTVFDHSKWTKDDARPPTINELSQVFRTAGVDLATKACQRALQEAAIAAIDITHIVAVTCTDQGNPGYDLLVCEKLSLSPGVQRTLLHGVGCAGGLSALRTAATHAAAASQRGLPARILVVACELCSLFLRAELETALRNEDELHIAPALFSDAAAAVVVCNGLAMGDGQKPILEMQEWGSMLLPGTSDQMSYAIEANGMIASISKDVPRTTVGAIIPMFDQLRNSFDAQKKTPSLTQLDASSFDWALHPGGSAILQGAKKVLQLTDDHIRASLDIYSKFGNSSSPTVLIVLDQLRRMGEGRDHVVATSFGPGLMIEMCMLRRCRDDGDEEVDDLSVKSLRSRRHKVWFALQSRLARIGRGTGVLRGVHKVTGNLVR